MSNLLFHYGVGKGSKDYHNELDLREGILKQFLKDLSKKELERKKIDNRLKVEFVDIQTYLL